MTRAFIGIALPAALQASIKTLQGELGAAGADVEPRRAESPSGAPGQGRGLSSGIKWTAPHQLHATLKFLGDIDDSGCAQAEAAVRAVSSREPAFVMRLGRVGAFPSSAFPRVVWVGLDQGGAALTRLAQALEHRLQQAGWPAETRLFAPHLTIGRVRVAHSGRPPKELQELARRLQDHRWLPPRIPWPAASVTLYQSVLSAQGASYTVLAEAPLAAAAATPSDG